MPTNIERLLADQHRYFDRSYEQFVAFGGPCVYFHREALAAATADFLSLRHLEMIYATLTAWGMHRMGDVDTTLTKLTEWPEFRDSFTRQAEQLNAFRGSSMLATTDGEFADVIKRLEPIYECLKLSRSASSIVANSKALHHLFPDLVPPIDRQYTVRFFRHQPDGWLTAKGKFKTVQIPHGAKAQFGLFQHLCMRIKSIASQVDPAIFRTQLTKYSVAAPKAIDNAIVVFVRQHSAEQRAD